MILQSYLFEEGKRIFFGKIFLSKFGEISFACYIIVED